MGEVTNTNHTNENQIYLSYFQREKKSEHQNQCKGNSDVVTRTIILI